MRVDKLDKWQTTEDRGPAAASSSQQQPLLRVFQRMAGRAEGGGRLRTDRWMDGWHGLGWVGMGMVSSVHHHNPSVGSLLFCLIIHRQCAEHTTTGAAH